MGPSDTHLTLALLQKIRATGNRFPSIEFRRGIGELFAGHLEARCAKYQTQRRVRAIDRSDDRFAGAHWSPSCVPPILFIDSIRL